MTYEQLTKAIAPAMRDLHDPRSDETVPIFKSARGKAKELAQRARPSSGATLVMANPLTARHQRWVAGLQEAFAVCEVTERRALEQVMANLNPDVLVVDLALPGLRGVGGLRGIQRLSPATKIVALTDVPAEGEGVFALKAGARGYCACSIEPDDLNRVVTAVQKGEIWAPRKLVAALIAELVSHIDRRDKQGLQPNHDRRLESLTERQRVVADLISRGASNKEIGSRLNITERTVKAHLTEAFRNVGVSDRLQLALLLQGYTRAAGD